MALICINNISVSFGGPLLLDGATLQIEEGERVGLLGRNGSGKSTLMKMLNGEIPADRGEIVKSGNIKVSLLPQDVPDDLPGTVYDIVASGGQAHLKLLRQYHDLTMQLARGSDEGLLKKLERVQHQLETSDAWHFHQRVETVIAWTGLDEDAEFRLLSAGLKRRVFLAKALANDPDLLLLDEPTNHLDIDAILWMEEFLFKFSKTIMFVTHDRAFLQKMATRIVEVDIEIQEADRSGKLVVDAEKICFAFAEQKIIENFTTIIRGDKVGIIGPNGSGNTTLLKILLGRNSTSSQRNMGLEQDPYAGFGSIYIKAQLEDGSVARVKEVIKA